MFWSEGLMLFFTFCVAVEKKPRGVRSEGNARCGDVGSVSGEVSYPRRRTWCI